MPVRRNTIYRRKSELDRFYTRDEVAADCLKRLFALFDPADFDEILEPSAGGGAFFRRLPERTRRGLDLAPACPGVERGDFFKAPAPRGRVLTVGNPPFGRVAALAVRFFNRAAEFSRVVAFVVPRTFRKRSVQDKLDARFHLIDDADLPRFSFVLDGEPCDVPCCFQIWERRDPPRKIAPRSLDNPIFEFVPKSRADFAVRRVGGRAGKCAPDLASAAEVSHYFLRLKERGARAARVMALIDSLDFSRQARATAGVRSLSKPEFTEAFLAAWRKSRGRATLAVVPEVR